MTIEQLFGTLQQAIVGSWRKHLRTAKYGKHEALDEFYKEMPEKVDALIEAWMGANGRKIGNFENLLSSANYNTLSYLKELKKICKQGYEILGENDELKSLLDDIVNLINSTLYKVKELSESKRIKNLSTYINEALGAVNESTKNYVVFLDHENPDSIYITNDVDESECEELASEAELDYFYVTFKSKLAAIRWNDESFYYQDIKGNNLEAAKKNDLKSIEKQVAKQKKDIADGYAYIESELFGGANEWEGDEVANMTAQDFLNGFIEIIQDSYVDGDSGYCYAVIDTSSCKVLLGGDGGVESIYFDDLKSMYGVE